MSAHGTCRYGANQFLSGSSRWNANAESVQPCVPFGTTLMKPADRIALDEDSELQARAGKSVERLISQQMSICKLTDERQNSASRETYILLHNYEAKFYDKAGHFSHELTLEKGSLLQSLLLRYDEKMLLALKESYRNSERIENPVYMQSISSRNVCVRVSLDSVDALPARLASILKPIADYNSRLNLYHDQSRFQFVENLNIGDEVFVKRYINKQATFFKETVVWIDELNTGSGIFFGVVPKHVGGRNNCFPNSSEKYKRTNKDISYVTGDLLYRTDKKTSAPQASSFFGPNPVFCDVNKLQPSSKALTLGKDFSKKVREVPIRMVHRKQKLPEVFENSSSKTANNFFEATQKKGYFMDLAIPSSPISDSCNTSLSKPSVSSQSTSFESTLVLEPEDRKGSSQEMSNKSCVSKTVRNSSKLTGIIKEGDRVSWSDDLKFRRDGVVHWIGHLRGHTHLYAGIEFDDEIGYGTGRYEGIELFRAKRNHAVLLPLSAIKKITPTDEIWEENCNFPKETFSKKPSSNVPSTKKQFFGENTYAAAVSSLQSSDVVDPETETVVHKRLVVPCSPNSLTKGSYVLVSHCGSKRYGVVRWIGAVLENGDGREKDSAAVEIDGNLPDQWQNALERLCDANGHLLFSSSGEVALVPLSAIFEPNFDLISDGGLNLIEAPFADEFEEKEPEMFDRCVENTSCLPTTCFAKLIGGMRGIQGYRNSCYLDSTLYAMFVQNTAFDYLLRTEMTSGDEPRTQFIQMLSKEIVYPLRRYHFVSAEHISKLRELLQALLPEMPGLTSDEKDPEELLTALFQNIFNVKAFLSMRNLNDGKIDDTYLCPLITDDVWSNQQKQLICTQSLLERSLYSSNIQFAKEPKILILQLPRYGKKKVFCKVVPQQELDVTHLVYGARRPCSTCSKQAEMICPECFLTNEVLLGEVTYCKLCYMRAHTGFDHQPQIIQTEECFTSDLLPRKTPIKKQKLQLSAVLSIETSHYVAFVRSLSANKWLLFDSMADRVGLENGYNVPRVKCCEKVPQWLSEAGLAKLRHSFGTDHQLPSEILNDADLMRLLSDCYICFYVSTTEGASFEAK